MGKRGASRVGEVGNGWWGNRVGRLLRVVVGGDVGMWKGDPGACLHRLERTLGRDLRVLSCLGGRSSKRLWTC